MMVVVVSRGNFKADGSCVQEFSGLDDDANIFKLIGPVLLKQDKSEAIMAVGGRLEFIEAEMYAPLLCWWAGKLAVD